MLRCELSLGLRSGASSHDLVGAVFVSHLPQTGHGVAHSCIHGAKQAQGSEGSAALRLVCGVAHAQRISTPLLVIAHKRLCSGNPPCWTVQWCW